METIRRALEMFWVPTFHSSSYTHSCPSTPAGRKGHSLAGTALRVFFAMPLMCICIGPLQPDFLFPTRNDRSFHSLRFLGSFLAFPIASDILTELHSL